MAQPTFPLQQGQLDFLCGVYAAINAMHERKEITELDQAAIPFRLGLMFMQSSIDWDLARAICLGVDEEHYGELLEIMSWRDWDHITDPTYERVVEALKASHSGSKKSAIVALIAHNEAPEAVRQVLHYTVVTAVTPEGLTISDSQGLQTIVKKKNRLLYDGTEVKLGSLFVMKPELKN